MKPELRNRLLVAIIGIPLAVACIYFSRWLFLIMISAISAAALIELQGMKGCKGFLYRLLGGIFAVALPVSASLWGSGVVLPALFLLLLLLGVVTIFTSKISEAYLGFTVTLLASGLIVLPLTSIVIVHQVMGPITVIYLFGGVWFADSAAYFFGKHFGKHKLAPQKSPNKSIEGAMASAIGGLTWGFSAGQFFRNRYSWGDLLVFGLIIGFISMVGDLVQSILKRESGVKDSGILFPGHGGAYDRFDSLIFVSAAFYLYFLLRGWITP